MADLAHAQATTFASPRAQYRLSLPDLATYTILILGAGIMLLPFLWMLATSLKTAGATFVMPPQLIPDPVTPPRSSPSCSTRCSCRSAPPR